MDITYFGHSSFRLKGKVATVVTDPFDASVGFSFPKNVTADIVTVSHIHSDHNAVAAIGGEPLVLTNPGEYEAKGVEIVGFDMYHDAKKGEERGTNTVFKIVLDGVSILHLGDLGHGLTDEQVEAFDTIDVLMIPVGGFYTIDGKKAAEIVNQIEPSIVVPMHYAVSALNETIKKQMQDVSIFLKEFGKETTEPQTKLSIKPGSLPPELQIVVLTSS